MTREQAQQYLPLIEAYAAGEVIQVKPVKGGLWEDRKDIAFSASPEYYRIKPKPQTRLMTLDDLPDGPIWVKNADTGVIELVIKVTDTTIETESFYYVLDDVSLVSTWSTSHKGPWKPFKVEVEASA